jgi:hypothetical protein
MMSWRTMEELIVLVVHGAVVRQQDVQARMPALIGLADLEQLADRALQRAALAGDLLARLALPGFLVAQAQLLFAGQGLQLALAVLLGAVELGLQLFELLLQPVEPGAGLGLAVLQGLGRHVLAQPPLQAAAVAAQHGAGQQRGRPHEEKGNDHGRHHHGRGLVPGHAVVGGLAPSVAGP